MAEKKGDEKPEIKETYSIISKKFKLPQFEELDHDFEISTIESEKFLLRNIRKKMSEKSELALGILKTILQPEQEIADLHECKAFNEAQKKEVFELYKRLMALLRESNSLSMSSTGEEEADYINAFFGEWNAKIKPELKKILSALKKSWGEETEISEELGYFG